jgi:hypothetical protein
MIKTYTKSILLATERLYSIPLYVISKTSLAKRTVLAVFFSCAALLSTLKAAERYSVATGNWNSTATWSATSGGASGASAPVAADNVFIEGSRTVTVIASAACTNLNIAAGSTLTVNQTLAVSGTSTINGTIDLTSTMGTKTFTGLVTINSGATWTNVSETVTFKGGITNSGTFTAGTGVHTFDTNSQTLTGTFSIPSVTVTGATVVLTNMNTLTVGTALIGTGGLTQAGSAVLNIGGTSTITTLDATTNANTVNYTGAAQTVKAVNYSNLTLSDSGIKTLNAAITSVSGNLTLSGTATATLLASLSIGGDLNIGSGTSLTLGIFTANGTTSGGNLTIAGTLNIGSTNYFPLNYGSKVFTGGTVNYNASAVQTVSAESYNNLTLSGTSAKTLQAGTTIASNLTLSGTASSTLVENISIGGDLTIGTGTTLNLLTSTANRATSGGTLTIAGTGILNVGGTFPVNYTTNTLGGTVNYNGTGAQTVSALNYANLTISGARTTNSVTLESGTIGVSGTLSTTATFTSGAYVTTGNTVDLTGAAQTIGGIIYNNLTISGTGVKTLVATTTIDGDFTIPSLSTLAINSRTTNFRGNCTNNGTITASTGTINFSKDYTGSGTYTASGAAPIIISGTANSQSIAGFTTTGLVSMTKTAGIATFTGNVSGAGLTINGFGGTLNLGAGLTHAFTGAWTRTNGTLDGGSSTLNLASTISGTGGTFTASTGTVNFNGAAQAIPALAYNNLTLSTSGNKTFAANTTISNTLSISGTAVALFANGTTHSANTLTLGGAGAVNGSWGGSTSAATSKNATYFGSTTTGTLTAATSTCSDANQTASVASASTPICSGSNAIFNITGTANATITYNINSGSSTTITLNGSGAATVTVSAATANQTLNLVSVKNSVTNCVTSLTGTTTITVSPTSVGGTASADQTICSGATPTALSLTGSTGTIQWQSSTTSASAGFADISLETSSTLTLGALTATTWYRAVVTSGVCTAANSTVVKITVNTPSVGGTVSADQTICSGSMPSDITLASNIGIIQWQSSTTSVSAGFMDISGQTGATLTGATIGTLTATTYYRAVVTNGVCAAANSNAVTITVNPTLTASISGAATICNGTTTTITFTGSPNTVVTYKIDAGADLTTTLNGAGTATITTAALSATTTTYALISVAYATAPTCSQTITGQSAIVIFSQCAQRLAAKVFIHGAYNVSTGLMNDGLRTNDKIPTTQPYNTLTFAGATAYSGTETFDKAILTTGPNAIVDWVLIELRDATTPATIVQRRAALLQSDGDVVDIDGVSPVTFDALANGNYHVVIRHRLCLATKTQTAIAFAVYSPATPTTSSLNFTGNSNALSGSQKLLTTGVYGLYIGDTDRSGAISVTDITNARSRNPTTPATFIYNVGYDMDFNAGIYSTDIILIRANGSISQVDLNQ